MVTQTEMLALLAAGGGLIYLGTQDSGLFGPSGPSAATQAKTKAIKKAVGGKTFDNAVAAAKLAHQKQIKLQNLRGQAEQSMAAIGGKAGGGVPSEVLDRLKKELEQKWKALSDQAKVAACVRLKEQFPNDPAIQALDCNQISKMKFAQVLEITGGAASAAVCAYYGAAAAAPVCYAVGSYLTSLFSDELAGALSDAWDWVGGAAEDVWDAVEFW